jgi:hypothetical protein
VRRDCRETTGPKNRQVGPEVALLKPFKLGSYNVVVVFNGPNLHRGITPRGRRAPLYPWGRGSSLWPQRRWELADRAGDGPPIGGWG